MHPAATPPRLDRAAIARVVDAAGDSLTGDWLLVGGALAALWFDRGRVTEDVDLVPMSEDPAARLALFDLAARLGLPIEVVNSAADYFVRKVPDWRSSLEPLAQGSSARIFRPTPTLFLLLKIGRLSEEDLDDCLGLLAHARAHGLVLEPERILAGLNRLPPAADEAVELRRTRLRQALSVRR